MNFEPNKKIIEKLLKNFNKKNYSELRQQILILQIEYPKSIFLLNLLGATNNLLNNFEEAINCFKKIIKLNKNFSDAYYNLGIIYKTINKTEESIKNYTECIKIDPKKFEAYNNLGNIYRDKDNIEKAIDKYLQCLEINPNYLIALQNFGICLQSFYFKNRSNLIDKHIINLLKQDKILRPVDIINSLISYLYLNSEFLEIIQKIEILEKEYSIEELVDKILNIKILICLLKITPITDLKIEKILKHLRKGILLNINSIKNKNSSLKLINAIAKQCFINEYLYSIDSNEEKALKELENKILNNYNKRNFYEHKLEIACLAAYNSLNTYKWSNKIHNVNEISDLVNQQIKEPKLEELLRNKILYKEINDEVSLKVKDQYENNPYPRWTKIALNSKPNKVLNFINNYNLNCEKTKLKNWNNINILVAGCGTGQHAITTATKYENSFVTAIDLSSKSLSYAKRKADELEIKNIDFIQMDILDLKNYGKNFEIIESVGVLHHMDDPYNGWQTLSNILKPHGLMMIGLYSKIARQHIKKIRSNIKKINKQITNENIKLFREEIIISNDNNYKLIKESPDFYSLSSLRDLLFHVKEHTFSIPEISKNLNKLNLKFCGFENKITLKLFKQIYDNKKDLYNLDIWDEFENSNSRIFAGMYQFWCQKI
ncbi:MAG: hypothetical protein CBD97_00460 [Pelagibacteraceae bacterium TMED237]|nr:MAG: hypothetical protein CBD97_00460 [Pelagibacteraceae bacterium TMED237]|tara:strand:+ start:5633 stop:7609 length:1977 start_codon:yes stop_codon:yes gene_type:complete